MNKIKIYTFISKKIDHNLRVIKQIEKENEELIGYLQELNITEKKL